MAFTDEQNEQIRNDLIREAQRCGITIGMRKTSVDLQITACPWQTFSVCGNGTIQMACHIFFGCGYVFLFFLRSDVTA